MSTADVAGLTIAGAGGDDGLTAADGRVSVEVLTAGTVDARRSPDE